MAIGGWNLHSRVKSDIVTHAFITEKGIDVPTYRLFDRFGTFDSDDATTLGMLGSVLMAARLRKPWSVSGWRRWVGAASFGSATARVTYHMWFVGGSNEKLDELAALEKVRQEQMKRYESEVGRVARARLRGEKVAAQSESSGSDCKHDSQLQRRQS